MGKDLISVIIPARFVFVCLLVLIRVQTVPKLLRKILGLVADALQIVEVFRRDFLKRLSHAPHGYRSEAVAQTAGIDALAEIFHQFPALGLPPLAHGAFDVSADVLHCHSYIVHFPL